jgi:hypothetical protein
VRWEAKRDTAVVSRTAIFGLTPFFPPSKAVSSMQGALASLPPHSTTLRECREPIFLTVLRGDLAFVSPPNMSSTKKGGMTKRQRRFMG